MVKIKKLIIACDGESASGKSTASKLVSKKYNELLGSRFKFKNQNFYITKNFVQTNIAPTSQLNLF